MKKFSISEGVTPQVNFIYNCGVSQVGNCKSPDEAVATTKKFIELMNDALAPKREFDEKFTALVNYDRMRGLKKSTKGFQDVPFLALDDLLYIALPILQEYGFVLTFDSKFDMEHKIHTVIATLQGYGWQRSAHYHCIEGRVLKGKAERNPAQDAGAVLSYGRRNAAYAVLSIFPSKEDLDNKYDASPASKPAPKATTPPKPATTTPASNGNGSNGSNSPSTPEEAEERGLNVVYLKVSFDKKEELKNDFPTARWNKANKSWWVPAKSIDAAVKALTAAGYTPMLSAEQEGGCSDVKEDTQF